MLRFSSEQALCFAISSGLVPEKVSAAPVRAWRDAKGAILVEPRKKLTRKELAALVSAGVVEAEAASGDAAEASCWPELVALTKLGDPGDHGVVWFWLPSGSALCDTAAELLRLGCDRMEYAPANDGWLLRAVSPPYFSVLRALEPGGAPRAFVPAVPGQERVLVEVGHAHPLARLLRPEPGTLLLLAAERWHALAEAPLRDGYELMELSIPGATALQTSVERPRFSLPLRLLSCSEQKTPTLWVLRGNDPSARVERLLANVPDDVTASLAFAAAAGADRELIVLRARPGVRPPLLELEAEEYAPHPALSNLFLPARSALEPPLRAAVLRARIAPDPDRVVWLVRGESHAFSIESLPDEAFRPLADFVDYIVDRHADTLAAWAKSATFDFDAFIGVDPEPRQERTRDAAPTRREPGERPARERPVARSPSVTLPAPAEAARVSLEARELSVGRAAEELAAAERDLLELDAPLDDPRRIAQWLRIATLADRMERDRDAALCFARAVWELPADAARDVVTEWHAAERRREREGTLAILRSREPSREQVRALAVTLVRDAFAPPDGAPPSGRCQHEIIHNFMDLHDGELDLRTAWLARVALSRAVGGDRLGLARARDRLLERLHRGLSIERDVPSFLRFAGGAHDGTKLDLLESELMSLRRRLAGAKRNPSATEAPSELTDAYSNLIFAYGAARLGRARLARELSEPALKTLSGRDAVHDYLVASLSARIDQALEGSSAEAPLPPELATALDGFAKLDRYKIDRVREFSQILEPHEKLDPILAFQRGEADPRGPELAALKGLDPAALARELAALVDRAARAPLVDRARLLDGAMDFFPQLPSETALDLLERIPELAREVPAARRAELAEEALMLAGHFGSEKLARRLFDELGPLMTEVGRSASRDVGRLLGGTLRTLRRVGLSNEAAELVSAMNRAARGKRFEHLVLRVHTAGALAHLGRFDAARRDLEDAIGALTTQSLGIKDRLELTRATARALSCAPLEYATGGLERLAATFPAVTDTFNTNTHLCLSVFSFVEALVLGYASPDLALGEAGRRFIDEDEQLVRRRIHRDLETG